MPSTEPITSPPQIPGLELPPEPAAVSKPTACGAAFGRAMGGGRRYRRGVFDPHQEMLLPPRVEDCAAANNPVRAIVASIKTLKCGRAALDGDIDA